MAEDGGTTQGRTLLTSYVWVDDLERFERLRRALAVAERVPATVVRMDAADFCAGISPQPGATTLVWHSAMWVYLPGSTRRRILAEIRRAGQQATDEAPLVHASWEWHQPRVADAWHELVVRRWSGGSDDGRPRILARGVSHGYRAEAAGPDEWLADEPLG